jgi:methylmalonyl-CoA/ethylmalonyl-CoA epimerase
MNLERLDHTAIAVRDLDEALARYAAVFGLEPSDRQRVDDQGVEVAFLGLEGSQIELICPTTSGSGVARFLDRHGEALHHIAFAVTDLDSELERLAAQGVELIDRAPRPGVHGWVAFVHPRGTGGVLVELVEHT